MTQRPWSKEFQRWIESDPDLRQAFEEDPEGFRRSIEEKARQGDEGAFGALEEMAYNSEGSENVDSEDGAWALQLLTELGHVSGQKPH